MQTDLSRYKGSLDTPVISDVLDGMGYMNQAMRPFVRPLDELLQGRLLGEVYARYGVL